MTAIKSLELDFRAELNQKNFGDSQWEDDSFQHMISIIENSNINKPIREKIFELLNDTSISLQEAYFKVLNFLEEVQ